jgi:hypothetical protein
MPIVITLFFSDKPPLERPSPSSSFALFFFSARSMLMCFDNSAIHQQKFHIGFLRQNAKNTVKNSS